MSEIEMEHLESDAQPLKAIESFCPTCRNIVIGEVVNDECYECMVKRIAMYVLYKFNIFNNLLTF